MESEVNCVELFAGAGGAALGIEAAGFTHLALCEWDKDACATLRAAGLGPVLEGDVREQDWDQFRGQADLVWASPPCQAWSQSGKREGTADDRNGWPWTMDALDDIQPTWFIAENVLGLTYHNGDCERDPSSSPLDCPGCYFTRVLVAGLRDRFDWVEVWKLDSADYGVPQRRRRIFLVAGPHPVKRPIATHCDPRKRLLTLTGMSPWVSVRQALRLDNPMTARQHGTKGNRPIDIDAPAPTLLAGSHDDNGFRVILSDLLDQPSPAVCATEYKGARHMGNADMDRTPMRASDQLWRATGRRRLEIEECALLQDFPVDHPFQGGKTSRYKQVGNAVPPSLAQAVAAAVYSMSARPSFSGNSSKGSGSSTSTSTSPSTGSASGSGSTS